MKTEFREQFRKDIGKIKDTAIKEACLYLINQVEDATDIRQIQNLKKLKGAKNYYRVRLGDYRVGIEYKNATITFMRFMSRKDIYKYFP